MSESNPGSASSSLSILRLFSSWKTIAVTVIVAVIALAVARHLFALAMKAAIIAIVLWFVFKVVRFVRRSRRVE